MQIPSRGRQARAILRRCIRRAVAAFEKEKVVLAKRFVKYLFKRCEHLAQTYDVYLMIGAGTTLYPLFAQIGFESILHHDSKDDWLNRLHITTNNLPGLENLINTGRSGMSRHSPLVPWKRDASHNSRAGHPGWLRCSSLT